MKKNICVENMAFKSIILKYYKLSMEIVLEKLFSIIVENNFTLDYHMILKNHFNEHYIQNRVN